jgi:hypothetical protein
MKDDVMVIIYAFCIKWSGGCVSGLYKLARYSAAPPQRRVYAEYGNRKRADHAKVATIKLCLGFKSDVQYQPVS